MLALFFACSKAKTQAQHASVRFSSSQGTNSDAYNIYFLLFIFVFCNCK